MANNKPTSNKSSTTFEEQHEEVQAILLRGVADQILRLQHSKLDAVNYHFNKIGLSLNGLNTTVKDRQSIARAVASFNPPAAQADSIKDLLSKIKMTIASDNPDADKVAIITQLITVN